MQVFHNLGLELLPVDIISKYDYMNRTDFYA